MSERDAKLAAFPEELRGSPFNDDSESIGEVDNKIITSLKQKILQEYQQLLIIFGRDSEISQHIRKQIDALRAEDYVGISGMAQLEKKLDELQQLQEPILIKAMALILKKLLAHNYEIIGVGKTVNDKNFSAIAAAAIETFSNKKFSTPFAKLVEIRKLLDPRNPSHKNDSAKKLYAECSAILDSSIKEIAEAATKYFQQPQRNRKLSI